MAWLTVISCLTLCISVGEVVGGENDKIDRRSEVQVNTKNGTLSVKLINGKPDLIQVLAWRKEKMFS